MGMYTTPEINKKLVAALRGPNLPSGITLDYAALRIEELEAEVADLQATNKALRIICGLPIAVAHAGEGEA